LSLDALDVDDLARILQTRKNSLIQQFRKLVKFQGADLMFTDGAIREIAGIALERGTGTRGLGSVVEQVTEGVLFKVEAGIRYVITDRTVRGGEVVKQSMAQANAPLSERLVRRETTYTRSCLRSVESLGPFALYLGAKKKRVGQSPLRSKKNRSSSDHIY
jgi:hypothetical protein